MSTHPNNHSEPAENPAAQLFGMTTAFMQARAICTAAQFGVADLINENVHHIEDMAKRLSVQAEPLYRLMRALSSIGVFAEKPRKHFILTPMSKALLSDSPVSLRPCLTMMGDASWWQAWAYLDEAIASGQSTIEKAVGTTFDSYLSQNPDIMTVFQQCLVSMARVNNPAILAACDFSRHHIVVDVGGGFGELLFELLIRYPQCQGILYDLPHVIQAIDRIPTSINDRCEFFKGDFFESIPAHGDVYILKQVLHDWDDERAGLILRNCQKVMTEQDRLLIIETILSETVDPTHSIAYFFDVHMMLTSSGGHERTVEEFKNLLEVSGLEISRAIPTKSSFAIIECQKMVS